MSPSESTTFRSLRHKNVRKYLGGMAISQIGAWVQFTTVAVVVDRLTESTTAIGVLTALQFGPLLVIGAWAGSLSDRVDRHRVVLITQSLMAVQAVLLALAHVVGTLTLGFVYAATLMLGIVSALDNPSRRGFLTELVAPEEISNAMSLNTAAMTGSRIFGPAIAALLISPFGVGWMFVINAVTSVAIIFSIITIDRSLVTEPPRVAKGGQPIREAVRFIAQTPLFGSVFIIYTVVSTFGYNHNVALPRIADAAWGNRMWFGWVMTATSLGSLIGSLLTAGRPTVTLRWMTANASVLGVAGVALAFSSSGPVALIVAIPLGLGGAGFIASMNSWSQDMCPPEMRGRVLAFSAVAFLGSYPIGGPITGVIGDSIGLTWSLLYGAVIVLGCVMWLRFGLISRSTMREPAETSTLSV
ncbi:MAG: MFS transporter [Ilumatobacteraceae bacterium]